MNSMTFNPEQTKNDLLDVANERPQTDYASSIDRVGMTHLEIPVLVRDQNKKTIQCVAKGEAFVSLDDPRARGIHMSRLFLIMQEILREKELSFTTIKEILNAFIESHAEVCSSSAMKLQYDYLIEKKALKSANSGWRSYPVMVAGSLSKGQFNLQMGIEVVYSSTCPCSGALARQLIQSGFHKRFEKRQIEFDEVYKWLGTKEGIVATPHSQRSYATLKMKIDDSHSVPRFVDLINAIESVLATPVQVAVKREDEQEFARLNAQNMMFCEDAARKIKAYLNKIPAISDFWIKANHVESLHPHNAVSIITKGIKDGYSAQL